MTYIKRIKELRERNPLVHNMTNQVVATDVANTLLASGASPIMAYAYEEVEEIVDQADALVLNIGTLTHDVVTSMIRAGKRANKKGIAVVLDPVGVGATHYRKQMVQELFDAIHFTLIRGNSGELATLAGIEWAAKGVDAGEGKASGSQIAEKLAQEKGCVVALSGPVDVVSDGKTTYTVKNGHPLMAKITGSGCMLSGLCGAFLAGGKKDDVLERVLYTHVVFGLAGERAADSPRVKGPGSFRPALHDALYQLTDTDVLNHGRWRSLE